MSENELRIVTSRDELTEEEINALPADHPFKFKDIFSMGGIDFTASDDERVNAYEREQERLAQEAVKNRLESHYTSPESGVPKRYWDESLDTYNPVNQQEEKNLEILKGFAAEKSNKTMVLCGSCGTGKTLLGCAVIRARGGVYKPMLKLLYEIDSTMSFSSKKTKIALLNELCSLPMLVLDEIGRGETNGQKDRQAELLYYILNERYGNMLPTVLITNLSSAEFVKYVGEAVRDRLNETCIFLEFNGKSYRNIKRIASGIDDL